MSDAFTSAGTTLEISDELPATHDDTGFEAVAEWTVVGEITDMGEFGREYNLVSHNPIGDRRTVKRKGSYNDGTMSLQLARVPSDDGQAMLLTARDDDASYSVKVTLQDGTIIYTTVQVMSYTTNVGSVDQILGASVALEIDNDIVEVVAP
ncbi:MAG: phage tail protein [Actinobacteria bacterium]|nr:phage tail protein [Actinomycetota bacterium]